MTDPPRWTEPGSDAPDEVRELFSHAARTKPIDRRVLIATAAALTELSARPAIAGALAKLIAIPQAVAALPAAVKLVTTIAVAGAVVVTAVPRTPAEPDRRPAVSQRQPAPAPAVVSELAPPAVAPVAPVVEPTLEVEPIAQASVPAAPSPVHAVRARLRATVTAPAVVGEPAPPIDALAAEVAWLDQARGALAAAPAHALSQADAHARRFPDAALGIERELIAIDALLRLDRKPEAARRAAELRARFPRGLYERRLTALLE